MSKLRKYKFSDLYTMSSGISSTKEQAGHGTPFLSFSAVFNNYFVPDELTELMDASEKQQESYSIKEGDIFLTRTSEVVDELAMSSVAIKDYPSATYSGFLKRLRPTQVNVSYPKFMAFYLRSSLFRKTMTNNAVMTLRASLNEDIFSYLDLLLPEFDEQVKIGDLLYAINQKIELNKRINTELESSAKMLYDYWFVQFDFPDDNGNPYKTSGGKMVYNDILKRAIPKGWEIGTISSIADLVRGVTYNKDDITSSCDGDAVPILRATNITGNQIDTDDMVYVDKGLVDKKQFLNKLDILITMSSGSIDHIGKNGLYYFEEQVAFGAFCAKLVAKQDYRYFLFGYTQSNFLQQSIKNECLGTNINNLNASLVKGFKLVIPNSSTIDLFNQKIALIYKMIEIRQQESKKLIELRDWLLPMLVNGQVKVQ
ncbi:restriction endonuclease subunit S [Shewanella sp. Isolate8]|uniref:restriction endonuclease subunit S n=1 Tax=Shewanella sp. Isolate8 TaxID=2908529 RepID=UPI001EFE6D8F|nr:restriction endonuclease subunit S [Shewanella sp. Isolate8]MCG9748234.1 restriction endonuclease subunit S [Shewanella sp. Isolate8]